MQHIHYILKRFLQIIPVLLLVTVVIFLLMRLIPGDPAYVMLGEKATPELVAELHVKMGLDKPLYVQYLVFLKKLISFNLGNSIVYLIPVSQLLAKRIVVTLSLTAMAAIIVIALSFPLGYLAGVKKDKTMDQIIRTGTLIAIAVPQFWIGLLLLMFFGLKLHWFPVAGWGDTWPAHLKSLILPAFTTALATSSLLIKNLRNSVVDVVNSDYVDFARSKGLSEGKVRSRHIVRNALISTITLLSLRVAGMLGGAIIIETVFALPGVGSLLIQAVLSRDYAVVQAVVFVFAALVLIANLITDISYSLLDPRVKLE
ncbi:ABC transporter permease [Paenibacillus sp. GP183]|uniref:ABC transporter permease n=1 Tax=Paenibacillus sp. GP183 TaxID=1882751 RepID=UPI00089A53F5|nr:ABC transporter permease [Paenibacillus sp. GP183]SEB84515.1 peptide/nickel transport system permease protein [Paenibacillus sp. GP183]